MGPKPILEYHLNGGWNTSHYKKKIREKLHRDFESLYENYGHLRELRQRYEIGFEDILMINGAFGIGFFKWRLTNHVQRGYLTTAVVTGPTGVWITKKKNGGFTISRKTKNETK